jgi:hypothetical protein
MKLSIWPSLKDKISEDVKSCSQLKIRTIKTDIKGNLAESWINYRVHLLTVLLTPQRLIIKNTHFTYLLSVTLENIKFYSIESKLSGDRLTLYLKSNGTGSYIRFWPENMEEWIKALTAVGIKKAV